MKKILIGLGGLLSGIIIGVGLFGHKLSTTISQTRDVKTMNREVVGFLPYWLISKISDDSLKYISTLTYFGLTLDAEAKIKKYDKPGEKEPGWYTLESGKMNEIINNFSNSGGKLSLVVFCTDKDDISSILKNPVQNANNLVNEILPVMTENKFTDLNLDIEDVSHSSEGLRSAFVEFTKELYKLVKERNITLTVEISPTDMIKNRLINVEELVKNSDKIVVMGYDYHYAGSAVTGPVGPIAGAESEAEYDVQSAILLMLKIMPAEKIVLGVPVYGYEWETLGENPRSAVIPRTGVVASNNRIEQMLNNCPECKLQWDGAAKEAYVIYKDQNVNAYHQIFYPNKKAMQAKIDFSKHYGLGGIAIWALGYEDSTVLTSLEGFSYKQTSE